MPAKEKRDRKKGVEQRAIQGIILSTQWIYKSYTDWVGIWIEQSFEKR
jgi:hypothetical protein